MNTSPRFSIKGNAFELVSSPTFEADVQQRIAIVEWINAIVPHFYLSVKASDEELRSSLLDGDILRHILHKLKYSCFDEGDDSSPSPVSRRRKIQRFIAAMSEMGLPSFEMSDLEKGSMKPVLDCLLALKEHSMPQFGSYNSKAVDYKWKSFSDSKFQRSYSPRSPESPTMHLQGGNKFHEVFQMKQGFYTDLPATKISELMKSNSLDNAPTQSLLSVVNGILDESIERKNAEIPQRVACLLRKVVQEIERRIATQAEHLKTQSNLFKAREEKYQSRIRVLETLAKGTSEETEIVMNQLQHIKSEKNKMDDKKKVEQQEAAMLKKQKDESNLEILTLKQELELAKKAHQLRYSELETEANSVKSELEKRLRQQEQLLEDSKVKMKELEINSQSINQSWAQKEHIYGGFMDIQRAGLQALWHSSEAIKQEMLNTQRTYLEELNHIAKKLKKLAEAAQSYHDVLNENRKLYNELQDLKAEVFSDTQPLIRTILDGYNVCIFAYGQTGSGKTYTMSGPDNATKEDWGVNYRALDDLFQISEDRRNFFLYEIEVQMIEIYNEQIRDLLSTDASQKKLGILTTPQPHGLAVPDASMHPVQSTEDVIELMNIGLTNRSVSATAMNERSSRSHSVVTIHVQGKDLKTGATSHGSLHLVDLAGSERVDRSEATGDRLREAQHINKSLSALGDVIFALAQKSPHVPYRNSKLTQVLQASLGGRAKTLMFVQVNPDVSSYSETFSTLKFAERVSGVELGAARSNKEGRDVRDLMDQVACLKDTIARKDEEIERLQLLKDPKSPHALLKLSSSSSRNGPPSSPSARSMGSSPQNSPTVSSGDVIDGGLRSSRSMNDLKRDSPRQSKLAGGRTSMDDDDVIGMEGADTDERLSDVSDDDLSVGTDTHGAYQASLSPGGSRQSVSAEKGREKPKTPTRTSQPSRLASQTGASRLSQVKTTLRATAALKKPPGSGSSSPVTPGSGRRRV